MRKVHSPSGVVGKCGRVAGCYSGQVVKTCPYNQVSFKFYSNVARCIKQDGGVEGHVLFFSCECLELLAEARVNSSRWVRGTDYNCPGIRAGQDTCSLEEKL